MAEQKAKKTTTRKPKATKQESWVTAEYKGKTYEVLEANEHRVMLTDGTIHFWVRRNDVTAG